MSGNLLIPGGLPGASRTIVVRAGDNPASLTAPAMDLLDRLPLAIDLTAWLASPPALLVDESVVAAVIEADPAVLAVTRESITAAGVITLRFAPVSVPVSGTAYVQMLLPLSGGDQKNIVIEQPITNLSPAGLSPVPTMAFPSGLYAIL